MNRERPGEHNRAAPPSRRAPQKTRTEPRPARRRSAMLQRSNSAGSRAATASQRPAGGRSQVRQGCGAGYRRFSSAKCSTWDSRPTGRHRSARDPESSGEFASRHAPNDVFCGSARCSGRDSRPSPPHRSAARHGHRRLRSGHGSAGNSAGSGGRAPRAVSRFHTILCR